MTCSIGFRSPSVAELRQAFFTYLGRQPAGTGGRRSQSHARRYRDKTLAPATHPAEIPEDMARTLGGWLRGVPAARHS